MVWNSLMLRHLSESVSHELESEPANEQIGAVECASEASNVKQVNEKVVLANEPTVNKWPSTWMC